MSSERMLVLGSENIDLVYGVDHIVRAGETISSTGLKRSAGGKGANQSAALGKAGMPVFFAGKIGRDGVWILDLLRSFGVDVSLTVIRDDVDTGQAIIQVDADGQNSIILTPGGNKAFTEDEIDSILSSFGEGDSIILQNEINLIGYAMEKALERGMRIILNPSPFDGTIRDLPLDLVDIFFVNEIEGAELAGLSETDDDEGFRRIAGELVRCYPKASIVLTAGSRGAYYATSDGIWHAPVVPCEAVDTTGAGDTFCGYFLASMQDGLDPQASLARASRAASITVSRPGAMLSMPLKQEVL